MKNKNPNVKIIKSRKYKDISLYLLFSMPASMKTRACSIVLSKTISEECDAYPSKKEMAKKKDMLYGMSIESRSNYRAGVITQEIEYSFIHPKFLSIDVEEYISFIQDTLYGCRINETNLEEAKEILIAMILRNLESPTARADESVNQIIAKDNKDYQYKGYPPILIEEIKNLTVNDIKEYYDFLLHKAQLYVYVSGDVDDSLAKKLTDFDFANRIVCKRNRSLHKFQTRRNVNERLNASQSTLVMVFQTPYDKYSDDFYKWKIANAFLGSLPCSLLFEEVREKQSLCYSIYVVESLDAGYVKIYTSIDRNKKKVVVEEVNRQIKRLINKEVDPNKFEMAKKLFNSSIESIKDSDEDLIRYYYEASLSGKYTPFNEYKKKINAVTLDDVSDIFKNYKHYFTYFLEGVEE